MAKGKCNSIIVFASILAAVLIIVAAADWRANAGSAQPVPGSVDDPLVTKSYVERLIEEKLGGRASSPPPSAPSTPAASSWKVEVLKPGMKLVGGEGAFVIVRNGDVVAFSTDGNGIPDLTAGVDIQNGQKVEPNHLLLFPREGTRGIAPGPKQTGDVWVVVQGRYTIVETGGQH
mgnify:FL=1